MCAQPTKLSNLPNTLSETKTTKRAEPEGFSSRGELETRLRWVGKSCVHVHVTENNVGLPRGRSVDVVQGLEVEGSA